MNQAVWLSQKSWTRLHCQEYRTHHAKQFHLALCSWIMLFPLPIKKIHIIRQHWYALLSTITRRSYSTEPILTLRRQSAHATRRTRISPTTLRIPLNNAKGDVPDPKVMSGTSPWILFASSFAPAGADNFRKVIPWTGNYLIINRLSNCLIGCLYYQSYHINV